VAGIASAWRRGGRLDAVLPPTLFIVASVPVFFVGLLLIYVFAVKLQWLPLGGNYSVGATPAFTPSFIWDVVKHALLPAISLIIVTAGLWVYSMRNNMITTIAEDYVKTARAKGLASRRVMYDYAARNAILPNLTGFAMQLGYVLGGAIVIEYLFSYPGLGYLFYTASTNHDLPLMEGLFLFYTLAVLVCVLVADLLTAVLDPRTRDA
jgi:peptide/nickel transport system permease protein